MKKNRFQNFGFMCNISIGATLTSPTQKLSIAPPRVELKTPFKSKVNLIK